MAHGVALQYIELELDRCGLSYGVAPCAAALGVTGTKKCFNSLATSQDRPNYVELGVTLRHAVDAGALLPRQIECFPDVIDIEFTPATVSLGEDLGQRATLKVKFRDHRDNDAGPGGDKYRAERSYDPFAQGSYWGKFRARHPFLRGRALRWIDGFAPDAFETAHYQGTPLPGGVLRQQETRHFLIETIDGPDADGVVSLVGKDALILLEGDRAQVPVPNSGYLSAAIAAADRLATLAPAGVGDDEYGQTGYLNLGGSEICAYWRDSDIGNDADALLLMHFDSDFSDSSASARSPTLNGSPSIDSADFAFAPGAGSFDGTDTVTFPDSDDWAFAGDFTLECRAKVTGLGAARAYFGQGASATNQYRLSVATNGTLTFEVISAAVVIISVASAAGAIVVDSWYHLEVVRSGNDFTLYRDGSAIASATDTDSIPNFAGTYRVGADGNGDRRFVGLIDELRVSKVARHTAAFTPPAGPYFGDGDDIYLTRAQFNTAAAAHDAEDRAQLCLVYSAQDVADIIADLLQRAGVPASYIPLSSWQAETEAYLGRVYTGVVAEPTAAAKLVAELIENGLALWWDDLEQLIRLQVLREISTDADSFTADDILAGSLAIKEQPERRLSQVLTYFGRINPLRPLGDLDNYRSSALAVDAAKEADYGSAAIKKIASRWIPQFGRTAADRVNDILLARFRDPPRRFEFALDKHGGGVAPQLGGGYQLSAWPLQDDTGAAALVPIQVTRLEPPPQRITLEAEEMLFSGLEPEDPTLDVVTIDVNTLNFDLRVTHDALYPAAQSGDTVRCIIQAGVIVGSDSTAAPAFDVGSFAAGVAVVVVNNGRIEGRGGDGGRDQIDGDDAGPALYTRSAVELDPAGEIWGGGGGGGGGGGNNEGGGGGAGSLPGAAFDGGAAGTTEAGGAGRSDGGDGGGPGQDGEDSADGQGVGGGAGNAIDGVSFVTVTTAGDIRGAQVN